MIIQGSKFLKSICYGDVCFLMKLVTKYSKNISKTMFSLKLFFEILYCKKFGNPTVLVDISLFRERIGHKQITSKELTLVSVSIQTLDTFHFTFKKSNCKTILICNKQN